MEHRGRGALDHGDLVGRVSWVESCHSASITQDDSQAVCWTPASHASLYCYVRRSILCRIQLQLRDGPRDDPCI